VVFFDPVTLRLLTWHFPIPISTDNSFQAETYVAWVVLSSMVAGVSWVMAMGDYTDRKSVTSVTVCPTSALFWARKNTTWTILSVP
jgi:hypothetical protein